MLVISLLIVVGMW